jgi:hypothetical protein
MITSEESQQISVGIFEDQNPLPDLEPDLTVTYTDGLSNTLVFPPTGQDGITQLDLPPVLARNGTIIPYEVCLRNLQQEEVCIQDSYLIWGNP